MNKEIIEKCNKYFDDLLKLKDEEIAESLSISEDFEGGVRNFVNNCKEFVNTFLSKCCSVPETEVITLDKPLYDGKDKFYIKTFVLNLNHVESLLRKYLIYDKTPKEIFGIEKLPSSFIDKTINYYKDRVSDYEYLLLRLVVDDYKKSIQIFGGNFSEEDAAYFMRIPWGPENTLVDFLLSGNRYDTITFDDMKDQVDEFIKDMTPLPMEKLEP